MYRHPTVILRNYLRPPVITLEDAGPEPISLDVMKNYLRLEYGTLALEDAEVTQMMKAARHELEKTWNVAMTPKKLEAHFQHDGCHVFRLPYGPVVLITAVSYRGCDCQALPYEPVTTEGYCRDGDYFKSKEGYYIVQYTTGFVTTPDEYINAIKRQTAWKYEHRGDEKVPVLNPDVKTANMLNKNSWI